MPKFVKLVKCVLFPYLINLFNKYIKQEFFLNNFKVVFVIPIPKTSTPKSLNNFRSISLLPIFAKLFEKFSKSKYSILNKNNTLPPLQHGFCKNNSTELAITSSFDKLLNNLN